MIDYVAQWKVKIANNSGREEIGLRDKTVQSKMVRRRSTNTHFLIADQAVPQTSKFLLSLKIVDGGPQCQKAAILNGMPFQYQQIRKCCPA